jgi:hypothetical protein
MVKDSYSFRDLNTVKHITLLSLYNEGVITAEQFHNFDSRYGIVLHKKSWFGKAIDRFFGVGDNEENTYIRMVKFVGIQSPPVPTPPPVEEEINDFRPTPRR